MATYDNNLRLEETTTGDNDGTWGVSNNLNFELVGQALGYGTKQLAADSNETFTMANASSDATRAMYLKITSAVSLTATRTVTLGPNTVSKVWIIENATTGGQSITISQGSGGTVTIATGKTKMVYTDGAGAGAAVVEVDVLTDAAIGSTVQAQGAVLDDLNTLGASTLDGQFLVATGAGALAWESGATARTSLGVDAAGTDNSTDVTLAGSYDYITISGQVITRGQVDLSTDVTGDLPYANLTAAGSASKLLGRGDSGAGDWQEITLGTNLSMSGTTLNAAGGGGSGDVTKVGTPADGQIGVWTGDGTIEGDSALTFDTTTDSLVIAASGALKFGAVTVLTDSAGTATLSNIDALDATTESTIESAIDTLPNLTTANSLSSATSLASVGTITSGTWQGAAIATGYVASTLTGKTLTTATLTQPTLTLKQGTNPTPTAEGDIQWDTDDNRIAIGDGAATKYIVPTASFSGDATVSTTGVVTLSSTYLTDITGESINDLTDVNYGTPAKGDILAYNSVTGDYEKLAVGTNDYVLTADSTQTLGIKWAALAAGGNVSNSGTPVDGQIGVWTSATGIEGDADLTFATTTNTLALAPVAGTSIFSVGGANILVDSPRGTMTLSNIDAIDATTETTLEAAIDALPNLTQTGTVTSGTWSSSVSSSATIVLAQSTTPTPTTEGQIQWDTDNDRIAVGTGGGTAVFSNDATLATTYQPLDSGLTSIAGLTTAANKMIYTTGSDTYAVTDLSSFARTLLDDTSQATAAATILSGASLTTATVAATDKVLIQDADASSALKTVTAQSIADLASRSWVLLGSATAANDATIQFLSSTISSSYEHFVVVFDDVTPATDAVDFEMRVSRDNGSTWESTANYRVTGLADADHFTIANSVGSGPYEHGVRGLMWMYDPRANNHVPIFHAQVAYTHSDGSPDVYDVACTNGVTTADIDAIQFYFSSGNVESGGFYVYGIAR